MRIWICKRAAYVAGYGIVRPGGRIQIADGTALTPHIRANFAPETPEKAGAEEAKKAEANDAPKTPEETGAEEDDMTFRAKVERLKDMKVKIPFGANKAQIDALYAEFVEKVELPGIPG